jgi:LemA protein
MTSSIGGTIRRYRAAFFVCAMSLVLAACGFNDIPTYEEQAKARWSDVLNQYQRRSDLIPNLIETVKGYARQESSVLEAVTAARASATGIAGTQYISLRVAGQAPPGGTASGFTPG